MTEWQPIDTAPKDETILIWAEDGWTRCAELILMSEYGSYDPDELDDGGARMWVGDGDLQLSFKPTHWMALPAPPKKGDE